MLGEVSAEKLFDSSGCLITIAIDLMAPDIYTHYCLLSSIDPVNIIHLWGDEWDTVELIFYASAVASSCFRGSSVCPISCERDVTGVFWGNFFKFGANVHLDQKSQDAVYNVNKNRMQWFSAYLKPIFESKTINKTFKLSN